MSSGPRIVLIGGTYRALCVLERLIERGNRVVAFVGQETEGERDFCSEIAEVCDHYGVPARSARKFGEEIVRWLEDRIRPDLAISVGVSTEIPLAIGGNTRFGMIEIVDHLSTPNCAGVSIRQRGQDILTDAVKCTDDDAEGSDLYLNMVDGIVNMLDRYLDQLAAPAENIKSQIPYIRPTPSAPEISDQLLRVDAGPETERFESVFGDYVQANDIVALRSHTDAIQSVLRGIRTQPEDEIICPGVVSADALAAVRSLGARTVLTDVSAQTLALDPERVRDAITSQTRAILVSHPFGQAAPLDQLYALAQERGIEIIEDAGDSIGATFDGSKLGRSPCTCVFRLPLYDPSLVQSATLVTGPSSIVDHVRSELGETQRLGAGLSERGLRVMEGWDDRLSARRQNASHYSAELVRYNAFQVPVTPDASHPVYSAYLLRITRFARTTADDLQKLLSEAGIESRRIGLPLVERDLIRLPTTEAVRSDGILLPVEQGLTEVELNRVLDTIYDFAIG